MFKYDEFHWSANRTELWKRLASDTAAKGAHTEQRFAYCSRYRTGTLDMLCKFSVCVLYTLQETK